jgi:RNA polymerase sigma-70 factor (ECF subfamily)
LSDPKDLLTRAERGDVAARDALFALHRARLKRMVRLRLNPRLQRRVDESDVVQEALLEAAQRFPEFAARRPLPFFLWLRQLTSHKLVDVHRRHLGAACRDVRYELALHNGSYSAANSTSLAAQLLAGLTSPSNAAIKEERRRILHEALDSMDDIDREVLALRHFEQLSNMEAAQVLGIADSACSNRYVRALLRLKQILQQVADL